MQGGRPTAGVELERLTTYHGWTPDGSLSRYVGNRAYGSVFGIGAGTPSRAPRLPAISSRHSMAGAGVRDTEGEGYA
jgi:hypothetical protein